MHNMHALPRFQMPFSYRDPIVHTDALWHVMMCGAVSFMSFIILESEQLKVFTAALFRTGRLTHTSMRGKIGTRTKVCFILKKL